MFLDIISLFLAVLHRRYAFECVEYPKNMQGSDFCSNLCLYALINANASHPNILICATLGLYPLQASSGDILHCNDCVMHRFLVYTDVFIASAQNLYDKFTLCNIILAISTIVRLYHSATPFCSGE